MIEPRPSVQFSLEGAVGVVTLNRPRRYNALTIPMMRRLQHALQTLDDNTAVGCVVIRATGPGFCTGQDIKVLDRYYRHHRAAELGDIIRNHYNPVIERIATMKRVVIAAVQGVAAGAGLSLAMACDLRVAGRSAAFVPAFAKLGLIPGLGGTSALVESVGLARAMELALLVDRMSAEQAARVGLVNRVTDDDELTETVMGWARRIASFSREATQQTKRALRVAAGLALGGNLDAEAHAESRCAADPAHRDLVTAFLSPH